MFTAGLRTRCLDNMKHREHRVSIISPKACRSVHSNGESHHPCYITGCKESLKQLLGRSSLFHLVPHFSIDTLWYTSENIKLFKCSAQSWMMGKKGLDVIKNVMLGGFLVRERNPSSFWQQRMPSNCFLEDSPPDVSSAALRVKHAGKVCSPRPGDEQRLL